MDEPLCFLNGRMMPATEAHLSLADAGLVQGAAVSEVTRTFRGKLFRLGDHLDRLFRGLSYTGIGPGVSLEELREISEELIAHNSRLLASGGELGLIHFVTPGEYPTYSQRQGGREPTSPTVCAHTFPMPFALWADKVRDGLHLLTPTIRHLPPECQNPHVKCRSRMHFFLAEKEAKAIDPMASALLLDLAGNVTETNAANFFMVEHGTLCSPTLQNTLPGISRATAIDLARRLEIPFSERDISPEQVARADEAFLSSTPFALAPVTRFNGSSIGKGTPGPIYRAILSAWSEDVELDIERQIIEM